MEEKLKEEQNEPEILLNFELWKADRLRLLDPRRGQIDLKGKIELLNRIRNTAEDGLAEVGFPRKSWKKISLAFSDLELSGESAGTLNPSEEVAEKPFGDLTQLIPESKEWQKSNLAWTLARIAAKANALAVTRSPALLRNEPGIVDRLIHGLMAVDLLQKSKSASQAYRGTQKSSSQRIPKKFLLALCSGSARPNFLNLLRQIEARTPCYRAVRGDARFTTVEDVKVCRSESELCFSFLDRSDRHLKFGTVRNYISKYRSNQSSK